MNTERDYFPECEEWSQQEREFANRAIQHIGLSGWHNLLRIQREHGKEAFLRAVSEIWPSGAPPADEP